MIEVLDPGPLTSVQTALGRPGWRHLGVPVGGAADPWSTRLANRLVGNRDEAAVLEMTLAGATLRFEHDAILALTGAAFEAVLDGMPMLPERAIRARPGSTLRIGSGDGARAYLAVGGGIAVDAVLGSAATDLRSGFGGHDGRALRAGDRLSVGHSSGAPMRLRATRRARGPIRLLQGPHAEWFAADGLFGQAWRVTDAADRTGVRLHADPVERTREAESEIGSMGLAVGAVQIPPDGRPIVLLADRPVTGGYPVPACVIRADIGRVAQLLPGDELRFAWVSAAGAAEAFREAEERLAALEPIERSDDELGWAGSLE